uniref:Uncharacterized protein n=1 Tax=Aegilops tauschii subsp. strangulata TaxID=200361 RepID=A0A452XHI7_AEGTS
MGNCNTLDQERAEGRPLSSLDKTRDSPTQHHRDLRTPSKLGATFRFHSRRKHTSSHLVWIRTHWRTGTMPEGCLARSTGCAPSITAPPPPALPTPPPTTPLPLAPPLVPSPSAIGSTAAAAIRSIWRSKNCRRIPIWSQRFSNGAGFMRRRKRWEASVGWWWRRRRWRRRRIRVRVRVRRGGR